VSFHSLRIDSAGRLELDTDHWRTDLGSRKGLPTGWADDAPSEYARWREGVWAADFAVVRWLCHGHIGLAVIWAAVARCVFEAAEGFPIAERNKLADEVRKGPHEQRLRGCIDRWVEYALGGVSDCPHVVLEMLGLSRTGG
jgi:hypothetical protein